MFWEIESGDTALGELSNKSLKQCRWNTVETEVEEQNVVAKDTGKISRLFHRM